jgi:threo-3-hydroxy-L-aspartate ammonia-lyase
MPDDSLVRTMRFYFERMKMIVEPTGCLSLAALLEGKINGKGLRVGVIISGGNIDPERFGELVLS